MILQVHRTRVLLLGTLMLVVLVYAGYSFYAASHRAKIVAEAISKGKKLVEEVDNNPELWHLAREIPDTRHPQCKDAMYSPDLPSVSVVICYRNESALLLTRTVHTIFRRTPKQLLDKIILVDDNGDLDALDPYSQNNEEMKKAIEELQKLPEIIYVQNAKTEGLIRSRTIGADRVVSSPVIVFLDSHCEVNKNWLEPILERIKEDPTRVIVPIIDIIDDVTYEYKPGANSYKGGFSTSLDYKWIPLAAWQLPNKTEDEIAPRLSPAMPGGLFAMDRLFWEKIGKYDQQMNIWGGENIEMSVRIWQCGGSIEFLPCSRIGHMFRVNFKHFKENFPYLFPGGTGAVVSKNKARCIEVWFDDYKPKFYKPLFGTDTLPEHMQIGDISDRVKLRKDLECKSFDWYYKNVYPELL